MLLPIVLMIVGLLIFAGSVGYALLNILRHFSKREKTGEAFDEVYKRHVVAMIGVATGGFIFAIGLMLAGAEMVVRLGS